MEPLRTGWIFRGQINVREHWPLKPKVGRPEFFGSLLEKRYGWSEGESRFSDGTKQVHRDFYAPADVQEFEA